MRTSDGYADPNDVGRLNVLDLQVCSLIFSTKIKSLIILILVGLVYICNFVFLSSYSGSNPETAKTSNCNGKHFNTIAGLIYASFTDLGSMFLLMTLFQVAGYAVGGGHILHMVCDLTIAADNAIFGQTGPKVLPLASFHNFECYIEVESRVDTNPH